MLKLRQKIEYIAKEQFILAYALIKWLFLAVIAGVSVGGLTAFFILSLEWAIDFVASLPPLSLVVLLPAGLVTSTLMILTFAPDARGHGTEKVIDAIHQKSGCIDVKVIPVKLVTTIITLATGGSAGKEGPAAQIGAGLTSTMAQWLRFNNIDRKKLVVCGISAGFSAVFGTPVAGAIFGLEVLYIGQMLYDVMLPSFISGVVAYHVATRMGLQYFCLSLTCVPNSFDVPSFLWIILAGIFFGLVALMHIEILTLSERFFEKLKTNLAVKALLGGAVILILTFFLGTDYLGLGGETMHAAIRGEDIPMSAFFWKSLITSITLSCGGSGGIVTPIFFIGATSGITFSSFFGLEPMLYGPLGFIAVLAACANTPIAATIMAVEIFGSNVASYAAIACIVAFFVSGHRSVYPSQILARSTSPVIRFQDQLPIDRVKLEFHVWELKVFAFAGKIISFWKTRFSTKKPD